MERLLTLGAVAAGVLLALAPAASASAVTSIDAELGGWVAADETAPFSLQLAGATGEDLEVSIQLADGTLSVDDSGLALTLASGFTSFSDVAEITFTGSSADVTTALAERLTWTAPSTPAQSYLRLSASVGSHYDGLVVDETSGHSYLLVTTPTAWAEARDAAAAMNLNGLTGYLTTITTPEENSFVTAATSGTTHFIAATSEITYVNPLLAPEDQYSNEAELRAVYYWGAGPEAGERVTYTPWFPDEPNGVVSDRCLLTNWFSGNGLWNDAGCSVGYAYVVEFGGLGTDVGPALYANLDAAAPPTEGDGTVDDELADTGFDALPALGVALLALAAGLWMLSSRRASPAAPRADV